MKHKKRRTGQGHRTFRATFRHWRTGKLMRARDYGYTCWPLKAKK